MEGELDFLRLQDFFIAAQIAPCPPMYHNSNGLGNSNSQGSNKEYGLREPSR